MSLLEPTLAEPATADDFQRQAAERTTPIGEYLGAKLLGGLEATRPVEAFELGSLPSRYAPDEYGLMPPGPPPADLLSKEQFDSSLYKRPGLEWEEGETGARAAARAAVHDRQSYNDSLVARSDAGAFGQTAGFALGLGAAALDPTNYIPLIGPASKAAMVARFGRVGGALLMHGSEAALNTGLFEPLAVQTAQTQGRDYGWQEAGADILTNALGGAVLGTAAGEGARLLGFGHGAEVPKVPEEVPLTIPGGSRPAAPEISPKLPGISPKLPETPPEIPRAPGTPDFSRDTAQLGQPPEAGAGVVPRRPGQPALRVDDLMRRADAANLALDQTDRGQSVDVGKVLANDPAMREPAPPPPGIDAYHGSPHLFDEFSGEKIGTGEGAQVYGHGLYFAEHPDVAEMYRRNITEIHKRSLLGEPGEADRAATAADLLNADVPREDVATALETLEPKATAEQRAGWIKEGEARVQQLRDAGNLYKARLAVDRDRLLDWDKPLSEQPAAVREALDRLGIGQRNTDHLKAEEYDTGSEILGRRWRVVNTEGRDVHGKPYKTRVAAEAAIAEDAQVDPTRAGFMFHEDLKQKLGAVEASRAFRDSGLHGIQYLDEVSRGKRGGTRNFVIFDASRVHVLERNGLSLATASPEPPHPSVAEAAPRVGKAADELATFKADAGLEGYEQPLPGHEPPEVKAAKEPPEVKQARVAAEARSDAHLATARGYVAAVSGPLTPAALAEHLGGTTAEARQALDRMAARGEIRKLGQKYARPAGSRSQESALEHIARDRGISPADKGEFKDDVDRFIPGAGKVFRAGGLSIDELAQSLKEGGFLPEGATDEQAVALLERDGGAMTRRDVNGRQYRLDEGNQRAESLAEGRAREQHAEATAELDAHLVATGLDLTPAEREQVLTAVMAGDLDPSDAVDHVLTLQAEETFVGNARAIGEGYGDIPFDVSEGAGGGAEDAGGEPAAAGGAEGRDAAAGREPGTAGHEAAGLVLPPELQEVEAMRREGSLTPADEATLATGEKEAQQAEGYATAYETLIGCVLRNVA